ncbi:MAG: class I SAM-dependent methyltransferase [Myxococcota bacterium]
MKDIAVELGPIQETLLIPLLGRAEETLKKRALLRDPKAVEIVGRLNYDFSKWHGTSSLVGACVRARLFDAIVMSFLKENPEGTVVEIGAGLNTRYERLDNGTARWVELDLPDSMALRREFFEDTERRTLVTGSVTDPEWHTAVGDGPVCFVSEAVLIYLDGDQVKDVFAQLLERFSGAWVVMDTVSSKMVDSQAKHDAMRKLSEESWFRWKCDDPANLHEWGLWLQRSQTFLDASDEIVEDMPWAYQMITRYAPWLIRRQVSGYRINRFVLGPPE